MPNFKLDFSLDDRAAALVEILRGNAPTDDFLRRAIEIGICELIENAARLNLEHLTGTSDYRMVQRKLFAVDEPKAEAVKVELKDPMMGLKPRGEPRGGQ